MGDAASKICETTGGAAAPEMDWVDISDPNVRTTAGVVMPRLIYGTAWKETKVGPGATARLVVEAVRAGFTGIDSACQPKHYHEPGVGVGLKQLFSEGLRREQLFIQTKFSRNQDPDTVPYDSKASVPAQVAESVSISLSNLGVEYVDSLVLHSPYSTHSDTMKAWRAMETAVEAGFVRQLGVSNIKSMDQLERLWEEAVVKPAVVQMRFHAKTNFEREMRAWCADRGVYFQSFWTLTANNKAGRALRTEAFQQLAAKYQVSKEVLFFRFVMGIGICPLTGTTSSAHMAADLAAREVPLTEDDARLIDAMLLPA